MRDLIFTLVSDKNYSEIPHLAVLSQVKWDEPKSGLKWKCFTYDVTHKKCKTHNQNFFSIVDLKTFQCRVFWGFEQLSCTFLVPELCPRKATCKQPVFVRTTWTNPAAKVIKGQIWALFLCKLWQIHTVGNHMIRYDYMSIQFSNTPNHTDFDLVESILLAIFWWQEIGWSYYAGSQRFGLEALRNTKKGHFVRKMPSCLWCNG